MKAMIAFLSTLFLSATVNAIQYAVPNSGNSAKDCVPGYVCLDDLTSQTFSIGKSHYDDPS